MKPTATTTAPPPAGAPTTARSRRDRRRRQLRQQLHPGRQYYNGRGRQRVRPRAHARRPGRYHVRDIEFVSAFDIDAEKVGKDLSDAIWSGQNDTIKFADVPNLGVKVERGMTHDGLGKYLKQRSRRPR